MSATVQDVHGTNLASSGKLKLRAKRLLALGTKAERLKQVLKATQLLHHELLPNRAPTTYVTRASAGAMAA